MVPFSCGGALDAPQLAARGCAAAVSLQIINIIDLPSLASAALIDKMYNGTRYVTYAVGVIRACSQT
jgi:hypothetical protein